MVDIVQAIQALDINAQFVINGTPTNEAEYQAQVKYVSGEDENGTAIFSDTQTFTWSEVSAKQTELQAEYDANQYQRDRATAYPSIQEQLDMQYWDKVNGTTNWENAIAKVKSDNPKT
jgi:hypothetical protein